MMKKSISKKKKLGEVIRRGSTNKVERRLQKYLDRNLELAQSRSDLLLSNENNNDDNDDNDSDNDDDERKKKKKAAQKTNSKVDNDSDNDGFESASKRRRKRRVRSKSLHHGCAKRSQKSGNRAQLVDDIEVLDKSGRATTMLHIAVSYNRVGTTLLLLSLGANVNARDHRQETPLHRAAWLGRVQLAKVLLDSGADANAESLSGLRPLHLAAHNNHREIALLLLGSGANVNARSRKGNTALHRAASAGHEDIAGFLIARGANRRIANARGHLPKLSEQADRAAETEVEYATASMAASGRALHLTQMSSVNLLGSMSPSTSAAALAAAPSVLLSPRSPAADAALIQAEAETPRSLDVRRALVLEAAGRYVSGARARIAELQTRHSKLEAMQRHVDERRASLSLMAADEPQLASLHTGAEMYESHSPPPPTRSSTHADLPPDLVARRGSHGVESYGGAFRSMYDDVATSTSSAVSDDVASNVAPYIAEIGDLDDDSDSNNGTAACVESYSLDSLRNHDDDDDDEPFANSCGSSDNDDNESARAVIVDSDDQYDGDDVDMIELHSSGGALLPPIEDSVAMLMSNVEAYDAVTPMPWETEAGGAGAVGDSHAMTLSSRHSGTAIRVDSYERDASVGMSLDSRQQRNKSDAASATLASNASNANDDKNDEQSGKIVFAGESLLVIEDYGDAKRVQSPVRSRENPRGLYSEQSCSDYSADELSVIEAMTMPGSARGAAERMSDVLRDEESSASAGSPSPGSSSLRDRSPSPAKLVKIVDDFGLDDDGGGSGRESSLRPSRGGSGSDAVSSADSRWNERYQELVDLWNTPFKESLAEKRVSVTKRVLNLAQDFMYIAQTYGRIIISEKELADSERTIPVDKRFGGKLSGDKYCVQNGMIC
jgi:ankyrin repeat protein